MDPKITKSIKIMQPGIKHCFLTLRQLACITVWFCSITPGSWRNFIFFFSTSSSIIKKTSSRNSTKTLKISSSYFSLEAISRSFASYYQNPSNSSAIFSQKSPWISILTKSHYKGRLKTESITHTNDSLRCRIGGTSSARLRKKKWYVKKPRRYNIDAKKNRVKWNCNPEVSTLFCAFQTQNPSHSTSIEMTQCPACWCASFGRGVVLLGEKSIFWI